MAEYVDPLCYKTHIYVGMLYIYRGGCVSVVLRQARPEPIMLV